MSRIALGIEYKGTHFKGFQKQPQKEIRTIQSVLEEAFSKVANHKVDLICAGRTDAGVHALEQVIHFDTKANRALKAWVLGVNALLPNDISVKWAKKVPDDFHARFSAIKRHYRYLIYNRSRHPAILAEQVTWHPKKLDVKPMQKAAHYLLGELDFSAFRSSECQSHSSMRNMESISIKPQGDLIIIDFVANAFLHHMVRNIVGTLLPIGEGKRATLWMKEVLESKDRKNAGITAPASGLYLKKIEYELELSY